MVITIITQFANTLLSLELCLNQDELSLWSWFLEQFLSGDHWKLTHHPYWRRDMLHPCSVSDNSDAQNHSTKNRALISIAKYICNFARCWLFQAVLLLKPEGKVLWLVNSMTYKHAFIQQAQSQMVFFIPDDKVLDDKATYYLQNKYLGIY